MDEHNRISVEGHDGPAVSAIVRCLHADGCATLIARSWEKMYFRSRWAVIKPVLGEKQLYVFRAIANVVLKLGWRWSAGLHRNCAIEAL